ncbi:MAG TPA: peroxiredoxin-like family protein [Sphingomonas sp.]|jgi:peroxiredoxin|nr:peroxiredoxin-like family protein [Sphingomonas sp.]
MNRAAPLASSLDALRSKSQWRPLYDEFVEGLRRIGAGAASPAVGEEFPAFALPNAAGHYRSLDALLADGPLVLSFNRGGWCPYCATELRAWSDRLPELQDAGGHFAAITPEVGGRAALLGQLLHGDAEMLCDVDHGLALTAGLAFYIGEPLMRRYERSGLDLKDLYGSSSGFLPIPATYVIDQAGTVRYAFADPDFRIRAEPMEVIAAVRSLRS